MTDRQTPCKDLSRRRSKNSPSSKSIADHSNKTAKTAKKSLNPEFTYVSEDLLSESVTESFNFSPIPEVLSEKHNRESIESSQWLFPADTSLIPAMMEALTPSDSGSSKITTVNDEASDSSEERGKVLSINCTVETKMVSNLLKQARHEVLKSSDIHPIRKKLLDALVEVSVKELYALPDEDDKLDFLIFKRSRILMFSLMAWLIIFLSIILFSAGFGDHSSAFYPPPT